MTDLVEVVDDPALLDPDSFYAVVGTYEGQWRFARFNSVVEADLPTAPSWPGVSSWATSMHREQYIQAVENVRERIARGELYQTNLCRMLTAQCDEDSLLALAQRLRQGNPAPFAAWLDLPDIKIACASPERFLEREGDQILSSPIKGTARVASEMLEKDRAENVMIVDLVRHDFGQICVPGSIRTPRLLDVEEHPGLVHLVSDVAGTLRTDMTWTEILQATYPAGSITGAPRITAMRAISELEPVPRGLYCGAIGWIQGRRARLAVGIRTFFLEEGILHFGTGAGITWASDAMQEWAETELKAKRLMELASA